MTQFPPVEPEHGFRFLLGAARILGRLLRTGAIRLFFSGLALPWFLASLAGAEAPVAPEYNVKAGFLVAFVQYTTWPDNTFASADAPVVIGVLGANPFGAVLEQTARSQQSSRRIEVRHIATPAEASGCQVIFISKLDHQNEAAWLAVLRGRPVLTVGENDQSLRHGSQLEFFIINNRVRFDVSWLAMEASGLKFSAPMLASARKVYRTGEGLP